MHGFCPKIEFSLIAVFYIKFGRKGCFLILEIENNHFKTKKLNVQEEPKNGHLLKGLIHRFCPKIEISLIAAFCRNYVRKDRFRYFGKKTIIFRRKN